jgi:hypothetical protein
MKIILIFKGTIYIEKDYDLNNTVISEREKFTKGTMLLKGHYKPNGL